VNYLGYPGTIGASYIDYIIADQTVIPDGFRKFYSEKIAVLPNTYLANDRKRSISDKAFTRPDEGLPSQGFVFCCFNNN
jgi:predicted O-linked N-acetylglucosamine transferase (SPINDLY family)